MMIGNSRNNSDPMQDVELNDSLSPEDNATPRVEGNEGRRQVTRKRQTIVLVGITLLVVVGVAVGTTLGVTRPGGASSQESSATGASSPALPTSMQTAPPSSATTPSPTPQTPVPTTVTPTPVPTTVTSSTTFPTLAVNATTLPPDSGPYVCTGDDRLNHEEPLYSGQVLCSNNDEYVFGMHSDGRFIQWNVVDSNDKFEVYYNGQPGDWFMLRLNGDIEIFNLQNELQWKREAKFDMTFATCLTEYACPYMHLHDDGVLVLNWRDSTGTWQVHQLRQAYDLEG